MNKARKARHAKKRLDQLVGMVGDAMHGNGDRLGDELDSMAAIARGWGWDYGEEENPRMAMICFLLADLAHIVGASIVMRNCEPSPAAPAESDPA